MELRAQMLTILAVSMLAVIALVGTVFLSLHGRSVPESLVMLASNAVSGLCGALMPAAAKIMKSSDADKSETDTSPRP